MIRAVSSPQRSAQARLLVAADVSKNVLDFAVDFVPGSGGRGLFQTRIPNRSADIVGFLGEVARRGARRGFRGLLVFCEATGPYS
jgi:hypothetical protein